MTTSPYSLDLRERVIKFILAGNTQTEAAEVFTLNLSTVNRWYLRHRKEGNCNPRKRLGAKSKVDKESLKSHIAKHPNATLQEISIVYGVSLWGIYYWLKKLGFSYKKKPSPIWNLAPKKREQYFDEIKDIPFESIVYIDETGIEIAASKDRGWGLKSKPLLAKKSGKYYERTNIISGLCGSKSVAPFVFNGNCNTELFESWIEQFLIKELKPGQVVIMDNATFHKSQKTKNLIESVGCKVIFLPPYSPDLNPIETFWANMKRWIRNKAASIQSIQTTIDMFFSLC